MADALSLYESCRRWHIHRRNALPHADADSDVSAWLDDRVAEIAVDMPSGNTRFAPDEVRQRFYEVQVAVWPLCRRTIALMAAGEHEAARDCLSRAIDLATAAPVAVGAD